MKNKSAHIDNIDIDIKNDSKTASKQPRQRQDNDYHRTHNMDTDDIKALRHLLISSWRCIRALQRSR